MKEEKIILLIHKVISGNASEEESSMYKEWLNSSQSNREFADEISNIWEKSKNLTKDGFNLNKNKIKSNIFSKIAKEQNIEKNLKKRHSRIIRLNSVASIAAVFLVVIGAFLFFKNVRNTNEKIVSDEFVKLVALEDNSNIWLKKSSIIEIDKNFNTSNRDISLIGSAYFEISSIKKLPFQISVGPCKVKVVGTAFDIISDKKNNITVNVYSGLVQFIKPDKSVLEVGRGKSLSYSVKNNSVDFENIKVNTSRLKVGYLKFMDENLDIVFDKISTYFNVKVEFKCDKLKEFKGFTSQAVPNLKIEDYFNSIEKLYPIKILKVDENKFIVKCLK